MQKNYKFEFLLIFEISVPTPPDKQIIMLGRHKNFEDLMYRSWDMCKTKNLRLDFFARPLIEITEKLLANVPKVFSTNFY